MSDVSDKTATAWRPVRVAIVALWLCAVVAFFGSRAKALIPPIQEVAGISVWALLSKAEQAQHPLAKVVRRVMDGAFGEQPAWKVPMLVNGLRKEPLRATLTGYTEFDPGCTTRTAWGSRVRRGIVAADRRYWGPGSVIWIGPPISETMIVEDVGSAIKGPHRFDVCLAGDPAAARALGVQRNIVYVPLHREPTRRHWSQKPTKWHPPIWKPGIPAPGSETQMTKVEPAPS